MVPPSLWFENKILVQGSQVDVETAGQVASTSEMNPVLSLFAFYSVQDPGLWDGVTHI